LAVGVVATGITAAGIVGLGLHVAAVVG